MVSVVSVHQWHQHLDDINVLEDPKETVSATPKTFETEGVTQIVTWQPRTLAMESLGSVVPLAG